MIAKEAANEAARTIQMGISSKQQLTGKGDRDFRTEFDLQAEAAAKQILSWKTPTIGFFGEEEGGADPASGDPVWVLDPIDGTINFAAGIPLCGVSLALYIEGRPVVGVIELPLLRESYLAIEGHGALRNGRTIFAPSQLSSLTQAIVSLPDVTDDERRKKTAPIVDAVRNRAYRIRQFGSTAADLSFVASGQTQACFIFANRAYDVGAGVVIAREAGLAVCDENGAELTLDSQWLLAARPELIAEMVELCRLAS